MDRSIALTIVCGILLPASARPAAAAMVMAATCNNTTAQPDVQNAIDRSVAGDTVIIPDGTCNWTKTVTVTGPRTIQGARACPLDADGVPTICATHIVDQTDYNTSGPFGVLNWATTATGKHELTGIWFDGGSTAGAPSCPNSGGPTAKDCYNRGMLGFFGNTGNWRMHHMIVQSERTSAIFYRNYIRGVNDHNLFIHHTVVFHYIFHDQWNNNDNGCGNGAVANGCADSSYANPINFGSSEFLFFENNKYTNAPMTCTTVGGCATGYAFDGWAGTRYVARFNKFTNLAGCTDHGTESANRSRGSRGWECYGNTFTFTGRLPYDSSWTGWTTPAPTGARGGTQRVFNNTLDDSQGGYTHTVYGATTYRSGCPNGGSDCSSIWWRCGVTTLPPGSITSSGNIATVNYGAPVYGADQSNSYTQSYVKISGASQGAYNGTFPMLNNTGTSFQYDCGAPCGSSPATGSITVSSPWDQNADGFGYRCLDQAGAGQSDPVGPGLRSSPPQWPRQALEPIYVWGNTKNGSLCPGVGSMGGASDCTYVQQASGPIQADREFYSQQSTFNGTSGVGNGPRAARPAACAPGVAYWSADQGSWNNGQAGSGVLDYCSVPDTWINAWYVPFTYPHPLVSGSVIVTNALAPAKPTNLRLQ